MSMIVPAGNKNVEWSPKEEKIQKTASTGKVEVKEEVNPLYEAAKKYAESLTKDAGIIPGVPDGTGPHGMGPEEGRGMGPCGKGGKDAEETKEDDKKEEVVIEPVSEEKKEVEKVEQAVEKIEEAVGDLKDVVKEEKGEVGEEEVEIEIEDGGEEEVEIEIEDEIPGKDVSQSDIVVESEPDIKSCAEKKDVQVEKSASTEEEFVKIAKLTPANRKKLADYWTNMLGFPKDYVSLMTKDYEK